jgi:hypothetical protein
MSRRSLPADERRYWITISVSPAFTTLLERKRLEDPQFNASRFVEACVFASAPPASTPNAYDPEFQHLAQELESSTSPSPPRPCANWPSALASTRSKRSTSWPTP